MRICLLTLIALVLQAQGPETMKKMVVRLAGPGIKANSYSALPKTIYVSPPHFARIEDPPDARVGVQKLTIVAEPDAYSINLVDKKGTHAIDQGGPNDTHVPILLPFDVKHRCGALDKLEFGSELEFFQASGAKEQAGPIVNAKPTAEYVIQTQQAKATLVMKPDKNIPEKLTWNCGDGTYVYEYITYEEVPFDPSLFAKPAGIQFKEIPPDDGTENG
ncbi:MAG: hypothetical protein JO061_00295 [Acidobacteriaceae bacterium]|nr:hypothetical protein [Acidobacteriaceae bacterium]